MKKLGTILGKFNRDEQGMEALQTVAILGIAAIILGGVYFIWNEATINNEAGGILTQITTKLGAIFQVSLFGNSGG